MRGAAALALLAASGCYSFSTLGRARIVAPRQVELFAAPSAITVVSDSGVTVRPLADLGVRYGLSDVVELDGRLTSVGATIGPRLQLLRSPSLDRGLDILIAPALAYTYADKLALELPVAFGWNLRHGDQIVLAPRVVYQAEIGVPGFSAPVSFAFAGASIGYAWRITKLFTLLPEIAYLTQIYADPGVSSYLNGSAGLQGSIGGLFDL